MGVGPGSSVGYSLVIMRPQLQGLIPGKTNMKPKQLFSHSACHWFQDSLDRKGGQAASYKLITKAGKKNIVQSLLMVVD